ncbi:MAG: ketopantoate reductase C-terminal domain-containing protein [Gemmataceae bacterium]
MDAVHIIGAGGIGCAVGYALAANGTRVTFVDVNPKKLVAGNRDGVKLNDGPPMKAEFIHFDEWQPPQDTTIILSTKCYDNAAVLHKLARRASEGLLPIQNGFDPALDALDHTTEGIASFVAKCESDAPNARITRPGELHIGPRRSGPAVATAGLASSFFTVRPVRNILPIKYAKLMYNAAISPLAAAAGIDNGQLLSIPAARRLFFELLQENYRILSAAGIALGKVGPFHPRTVAWILRRKWLAKLMARGFEPSLRGTYCSMAGEIQKGRTEIDNYNGHLIRLAEKHGTPHPLNRAVFDLVTRMTAERATPSLDAIRHLA